MSNVKWDLNMHSESHWFKAMRASKITDMGGRGSVGGFVKEVRGPVDIPQVT